MLAVFS
ncbi:hypothetical protein YPPY58_4532, partial [Yersinia pestis PY-58]